MKKTIYWLLLLTVAGLLVGAILIYVKKGQNYIEFFQLLSGFSTFVVALLTAAYVFTTYNQLLTMQKQLEEMSKGRELENQPFPWLENPQFRIRKPKTYYYPINNEASIHSLYYITYKVKNIGKGAAVGVFVDPKFIAKTASANYIKECVPIKIEVIEEGKYFEYDKPWYDECNRVVIATDRFHVALQALLKGRVGSMPKFYVSIYYSNFLGAAFRIDCAYEIFKTLDPGKPSESLSTLKEWVSKLTDANVKLSTALRQVEATFPIDPDEGRKKFDTISAEFDGMMQDSTTDFIDFPVILIASDFKVSNIPKEDYRLKIKQLLEDDERRRYDRKKKENKIN